MIVRELGVELSFQFREPPVGKLAAPGLERLPYPLPMAETIDMERAIALVGTRFSTAGPEESAGSEVSPEYVQFVFFFHRVHITSRPTKSMD